MPHYDPRIEELRALGAQIGHNVYFGPDVYIERDFAPLLTIEDDVVLARGVCVLLHDSSLNNVAGEALKFGTVTLRRRCYIGANTTILCGVEVGEEAIVGACSLVTASVPGGTVAFGQPARNVGTVQELIEKHRRMREEGDRFYYLDLPPWRERINDPDADHSGEEIRAFLRRSLEQKQL
ncbi:MAG: acyltransferase [Chloroflexota bacterium]|nr:MAG: hypothetical protein DIU80_11425 [Chloroflexota bacterium]